MDAKLLKSAYASCDAMTLGCIMVRSPDRSPCTTRNCEMMKVLQAAYQAGRNDAAADLAKMFEKAT